GVACAPAGGVVDNDGGGACGGRAVEARPRRAGGVSVQLEGTVEQPDVLGAVTAAIGPFRAGQRDGRLVGERLLGAADVQPAFDLDPVAGEVEILPVEHQCASDAQSSQCGRVHVE